jgi:GDP-D-mannose dehydratase
MPGRHLAETNPLRPRSPYAVSKSERDMMGYQYFRATGCPSSGRARSTTRPAAHDVFVTSSFAKQVADIEGRPAAAGDQVGDLKPRRDYSDVRDIVRGYRCSSTTRGGLQPLLRPLWAIKFVSTSSSGVAREGHHGAHGPGAAPPT